MGSFIGHVVPGSFFVLVGVWWTFQIWRKYLKSFTKSGESFRCQVTYPPKFECCNVDLEPIIMCSAAVIGLIIELGFHPPIEIGNEQHATMYFFFGLIGIIGILTPVLSKLFPNFDDILYIAVVMAYAAEAIIFKFHLMGRDMMNVTLHTLLLYAVYGCVIMTLAELVFRNQVLTSLGRAFFTIFQGTWFWQVAFILFDPFSFGDNTEWDHEDHEQIMLITTIYTWHIGCIFLFSLLCGIGWACVYRRGGELTDVELTVKPINNGYRHLLNQDDMENATLLNQDDVDVEA